MLIEIQAWPLCATITDGYTEGERWDAKQAEVLIYFNSEYPNKQISFLKIMHIKSENHIVYYSEPIQTPQRATRAVIARLCIRYGVSRSNLLNDTLLHCDRRPALLLPDLLNLFAGCSQSFSVTPLGHCCHQRSRQRFSLKLWRLLWTQITAPVSSLVAHGGRNAQKCNFWSPNNQRRMPSEDGKLIKRKITIL